MINKKKENKVGRHAQLEETQKISCNENNQQTKTKENE